MNLKRFYQHLEIPAVGGPEMARRRKLLNILIFGVGVIGLVMIVLTGLISILDLNIGSLEALYGIGAIVIFAAFLLYYINQRISPEAAGLIFLLLFSALLPFSDTPAEVADGQSLFVFTIPIIMSSVLLRPYTSFIFASISSLEVIGIALYIHIFPNVPAIAGYYMVALISWLSAHSLEDALNALIVINRELDKRVADRTRELSDALQRVRVEAGKTQSILESIADGVVVFDNTNHAIVTNPAIEPLLGYKPGELLGQKVERLLGASGLTERERQAALALLKEPAPENVKMQWGQKTLAMNAALVRDAGGEVIGKVAVFHDFTREAEVDRMKNEFLAMVSHELRTPLNSVLGYTEMLKEGVYGNLLEKQVTPIERIIANTRRLLSIVNDLLDQAQIEAGKVAFRWRSLNPNELLEHLTAVMELIVHAKGLTLLTSISDDMPASFLGDPQRLNQVLVNLVSNAVKFTDQGSIQVRIFRASATHWGIEVSDTGVGIPFEAQKYIFEPFRQVNMEVTRQHGGIGLGLSIVKRLVNLMQGEIDLKSQAGQGSTFTILLPLQPSQSLVDQKEKDPNE